MKKLALHWKIIIGMVLGLLWGLVAIKFHLGEFTLDWIKPFGTLFINLLMLIAVPLIFASLVKGIAGLTDIAKLSKIGAKTIGIYLTTTVIAITLGLGVVNVVKPGKLFSEGKRQELKEQYAAKALEKKQRAEEHKEAGPLKFIVDIVPRNFVAAATDNTKMLQVIFFAILFGIAMLMLPNDKVKHVIGFFSGVNDIILQIVDIIMRVAPYGVFALLAGLLVDIAGDDPRGAVELLQALSVYSITVVIGLGLMVLVIYPIILKLFTKVKYLNFFKGIMPAQMLAFSTSSSAATLPVTMERCEDHLGISKEITSFVLPLGATINMDGTSLYQAVAAVFIAQAFGMDLTIADQLTIVLTATLASIGAAAVPGAGMVMLVIVLGAIGLDPEGIVLIFAVDRILDMLRTVVNITGDAMVATVVASTEGQIRKVTEEELMS